ncbi:hypothetical protein WV31_02170 [Magnetospirillum sp. ME-1]|uniref:Periplasmic protein p19 involved in high-affinity Fe2+ transport n=1 Tax=Paramagnetospirillum magneticum (strain ATCC 700264 / AMB-1) TaxID=342108 RepID=Q2W8T2_PARM1|nr:MULTISPECIES: iron transporter [Rhodospirillales]ARJ64575.1 hypothetical protein WV31_02170 [Magnetospirillum sp. ME-1]BAE49743.1 Uncharacterized protein amb0939 [Paramagnetospirillum magneticum AMB-1]
MVFSKYSSVATAAMAVVLLSGAATAGEIRIGDPVEKAGMKIAGVYLQAVLMDPENDICGPHTADIHLEADVHALKGNPNGLGKGEWVPYMNASYVLTKKGSDFKDAGPLVAMVANDGPHYGRNVKMAGPGTYHVVFTLQPPSANGMGHHVSKETGVAEWWAPITQEWDFDYVGSTGKKGGY